MVQNDVSFILPFVILTTKMWIFGFSPGVCPTKPSNLVFSFGCLVSNGGQALLGGIRLGGSTTASPHFTIDAATRSLHSKVDLLALLHFDAISLAFGDQLFTSSQQKVIEHFPADKSTGEDLVNTYSLRQMNTQNDKKGVPYGVSPSCEWCGAKRGLYRDGLP